MSRTPPTTPAAIFRVVTRRVKQTRFVDDEWHEGWSRRVSGDTLRCVAHKRTVDGLNEYTIDCVGRWAAS